MLNQMIRIATRVVEESVLAGVRTRHVLHETFVSVLAPLLAEHPGLEISQLKFKHQVEIANLLENRLGEIEINPLEFSHKLELLQRIELLKQGKWAEVDHPLTEKMIEWLNEKGIDFQVPMKDEWLTFFLKDLSEQMSQGEIWDSLWDWAEKASHLIHWFF